jgi:Zn-finger nucleic acid-binding protein
MLKCPACHVLLCAVEYEGQIVHVCPDCRGALVQEPRLERIKRRREQKWSTEEEGRVAGEVAAADKAGWVPCPRCLVYMEKLKVSGVGHTFHLDRCGACQLVWLDPGELELIQIQYEKEIDSRTPEDWKRIERMGLAQLELNRQLEAEREQLARTDKTLRSVTVDFASVNLAAIVAAWAVIKVMEGMEELSPVCRRRALIMAAAGIFIAIAIVLLSYYMTGGYWPRWHGLGIRW